MLQVSIIVPIFGETDNFISLLPQLERTVTEADLSAEYILVADSGDDEISRFSESLSGPAPVRCISSPQPQAATAAVIQGMQAATAEILLVLDGIHGLSTDAIQKLYTPLKDQQADFVIGTHEVQTHSRMTSWLIRPLTKMKGPWSGCFALSRNEFENIREILNPASPLTILEFLVKGHFQNPVEVPIRSPEHRGSRHSSVFKKRMQLGAQLKELYEFKFKNYAYFLQFAIVGSSGVIVNLLALSLLLGWLIRPVAVALAIVIAMTSNFLLNRHITFSYARHAPILKQYLAYCGSCLTGNFFNWLTTLVLCGSFRYFAERTLIAALIGILVGMGFNFLLCRVLVFARHKSDEPARVAE